MNDLMTKSFLSYVELKKQARKDLELEECDVEKGITDLNPANEENLSRFFAEVSPIKDEMEEITSLLFDLQKLNEETKSTHSAKVLRGLRDQIESDTISVLRKSQLVRSRLDSLDRANLTNRKEYEEGSYADRTRIVVTDGLRSKLKEIGKDFQSVREKILFDQKEDLKRKYYNATGEQANDDLIEKMISGSVNLESMQMKTDVGDLKGVKERHDAVLDLQKSLNKLQQVFLDMAMLVDAQGEQMDDIESNVMAAKDFVSGGTNSLYYANQIKKKKKTWLYSVFAVVFVISLVCFISLLAS